MQEKVQELQDELVQCYRAQTQVSEQFVEEIAASKVLKLELSQTVETLVHCQKELLSNRFLSNPKSISLFFVFH